MQIIQKKLLKNSKAYLKGYVRSKDPKRPHLKYPAMIILPGGSFTHIPEHQAESFALTFTSYGYQSFYLRYSFEQEHRPLYPYPLLELCQAIMWIRKNADRFNIDPRRVVVAGFSIGGQVVSLLNDFYDSPWFKRETDYSNPQLFKPNATILGYPVIDLEMGFPPRQTTVKHWIDNGRELRAEYHVTDTNVPTFIWVTADDPFVSSLNAMQYGYELDKHHIPCEVHMFYHGPHGLALANRLTAWTKSTDDPHVARWIPMADEFIRAVLKK